MGLNQDRYLSCGWERMRVGHGPRLASSSGTRHRQESFRSTLFRDSRTPNPLTHTPQCTLPTATIATPILPQLLLRRLVALALGLLLAFLLAPTTTMAQTQEVTADDSTTAGPLDRVVVLGARGGTGRRVVQHLKEAGAGKVLAVARNTSGETSDGNVEWVQGDVKDDKRMAELFEGATAVVFAAGASEGWKLGGTNTPKQVDNEAVASTARVAVEAKVPRYLLVSSAFVARPFHPIALMLSTFFGKVMQWKRKGELAAIEAIKASGGQTAYTIVRPGGLSDKREPVRLAGLRISQGDVVSGMITRDDTAKVCVEALRSEQAKNTVFEIVTWPADKAPATVPADWPALFAKLQPNDGKHAKGFYPEEPPVPVAAKTDL